MPWDRKQQQLWSRCLGLILVFLGRCADRGHLIECSQAVESKAMTGKKWDQSQIVGNMADAVEGLVASSIHDPSAEGSCMHQGTMLKPGYREGGPPKRQSGAPSNKTL